MPSSWLVATALALCWAIAGQPGAVAAAAAPAQTANPVTAQTGASSIYSIDPVVFAWLDKALPGASAEPSHSDIRFWAARAAVNAGDTDKALIFLTALDETLPEVADFIWYLRASALRQRHQWSQVQHAWQTLLERYPTSPWREHAYFGLADSYLALGELDQARAAYRSALKAFPRASRGGFARFNLGQIAYQQGRYSEAVSVWSELSRNSAAGSAADLAAERLAQMVRENRAAPLSPVHQLAQVDRLLERGALTAAQELLSQLEAATSSADRGDQVAIPWRQAQIAYRSRNFKRASELFTTLAAQASGSRRAQYQLWLARSYAANGQFDEAIALVSGLARQQQNSRTGRDHQFLAAWLAYDGARFDDATRMFDDFLRRYPNDRRADEALWYQAWSAYRSRRLDQAVQQLERLRAQFPRSSLVWRAAYWQGRILEQMGERQGALAAFTAAQNNPLGYYALLAQQRLNDLKHGVTIRQWHGSALLAALDIPAAAPDAAAPPAAEPPEAAARGAQPERGDAPGVAGNLSIPWGKSLFVWNTATGQRTLRLIKLGYPLHAASLVSRLSVQPGARPADVAYARARLLYELGDYFGAHRIVTTAFARELGREPTATTMPLFQLAYPTAFAQAVGQAAAEFDVPAPLLWAIMRQESAFNTQARSWASAAGLMQIIPATGQRIAAALGLNFFNEGTLADPTANVRFGAWYLAQLLHKFQGNVVLAIGSYNAGPRAVERWIETRAGDHLTDEFIEDIPYRETRHYIKEVLANLALYNTLYGAERFQVPSQLPTSYQSNVDF